MSALVFGYDFLDPALAGGLVAGVLQPVHNLLQHRLGIADYADVYVAVLPDFAGVHHYLYQFGVLREHRVRAVAQPEVDGRADEYHGVGLHQSVAASEAAQVGMVGRDAAAPHSVQEHGGVDRLNELAELFGCVVPPDV